MYLIALVSPHPPVPNFLAHTYTQVHRSTQCNQSYDDLGEIDISKCHLVSDRASEPTPSEEIRIHVNSVIIVHEDDVQKKKKNR